MVTCYYIDTVICIGRYYVGILFAQMVCGSFHLSQKIPMEVLSKVTLFLEKICGYNPDDIRNYELEEETVWKTYESKLSFLYTPFPRTNRTMTEAIVANLRTSACQVLLLNLEISLGRQDHVDNLIEEDLLDYVLALPWNVTQECKERARRVCESRHSASIALLSG